MTWQQMAEVSYAVERGALYLVTNRDLTIPRELGIAPGCGSMIQAVINATGVEPIASAGKPESAMYDEARLLAAGNETEPVSRESCLAIGDRLDTDIEAGNRGGYDSLAVLTGVTNPHELMTAPAHLRPSYIVRDLRGLQGPAIHRCERRQRLDVRRRDRPAGRRLTDGERRDRHQRSARGLRRCMDVRRQRRGHRFGLIAGILTVIIAARRKAGGVFRDVQGHMKH